MLSAMDKHAMFKVATSTDGGRTAETARALPPKQALAFAKDARDKGLRSITLIEVESGKRLNLADFEALCEDGTFDA